MLGGTWFTGRELAGLVSALTGRRLFATPIPDAALRAVGRLGDAVGRVSGIRMVFTAEGMATLTESKPTDDSHTIADLGVARRAAAQTVSDTLRWLHHAGHLRGREVGRLATAGADG
jgi:hypothetical protein